MARNVMETIRLQSDDLREELKELEMWENDIAAKRAARKTTSAAAASPAVEPPIRGTVSSLKEAVNKAVEDKKKNAGPDPVQVAKEKGNEYFRLNKLMDAIEEYTKGIETDPNSSIMHVLYANRAMCYLRLEQWEKAERDASVSANMNTAYAKAYFRRAMARKNLGKLKDARLDLEAVLALAPGDGAARSELEVVTTMLRMERAKEESQKAKSTSKKIVIEEVDDDEEEEEEGDSEAKKAAVARKKAEEEEAYQRQLREQEEEIKRREREAEEARREKVERENKAKAARMRKNDRVEIIEEVVEEAPSEAASASAAGHNPSSSRPKAAPEAAAPRKLPSLKPTKESLKPARNYTEFERIFASVEADEALRNHYVSLLDPTSLRSLFGSNLTPELLNGILQSLLGLPQKAAFDLLKGLSTVNRIDDITLFFSDEEKKLLANVVKYVQGCPGVSEGDIKTIQQKLMPF